MARRVAVLGAKGRAEGVNLGKRQREDLSFELAANGEKGRLAEKILLPVGLVTTLKPVIRFPA